MAQGGDIWQLAANSLAAHVAVLDERGYIIAVNEAWRRFAASEGAEHDQLGANYIEVWNKAGDPVSVRMASCLREVATGLRQTLEYVYPCHSEHEQRWFLFRATRTPAGSAAHVVVSHEDVSEIKLRNDRARAHSLLLDQVNVSVHTTDLSRTVQTWNAGAEQLFGWTADEAIGQKIDDLVLTSETRGDPALRKLIGERLWAGDLMLARKDGSTFPAHIRSRPIKDSLGSGTAILAITIDISDRLRNEHELKLARDRMRAVTNSIGEGMLTINRIGQVTYMNPVAERQLGWSGAALEGQDLHSVTHNCRRDGSPLPAAECQILQACHERIPVEVDDDIFVRADGTLLEVAYTAAPFSVGDEGSDGCVIVFRDVASRNAERRRMERDVGKLESIKLIREALDEDLFVLFAQPIFELDGRARVQEELLIRMQNRAQSGQIIMPGAFLPVAEEFGLIVEIDRWVIDQAAQLAATGRAVEVNVSAVSIGDPGLVQYISAAIERCGADPTKLIFEITETAIVEHERAGLHFVQALQELGCPIALDDFGTGYGGFTYLKRLPVDIVKIDIEFVRDLTVNAASQAVVKAIVNIARSFDVLTVAEGVEDEATLSLLGAFGVDQAQGYHLGPPAPLAASPKAS